MGGTSGRFGGEMAINRAFVLGRSGNEGGQELQSMAAACALTAWRPRLLTPPPKKGQRRSQSNAFLRSHSNRKIFVLTHKKCTLCLENSGGISGGEQLTDVAL